MWYVHLCGYHMHRVLNTGIGYLLPATIRVGWAAGWMPLERFIPWLLVNQKLGKVVRKKGGVRLVLDLPEMFDLQSLLRTGLLLKSADVWTHPEAATRVFTISVTSSTCVSTRVLRAS